jgi:hypothetical protein
VYSEGGTLHKIHGTLTKWFARSEKAHQQHFRKNIQVQTSHGFAKKQTKSLNTFFRFKKNQNGFAHNNV